MYASGKIYCGREEIKRLESCSHPLASHNAILTLKLSSLSKRYLLTHNPHHCRYTHCLLFLLWIHRYVEKYGLRYKWS